MTAEAAKQMERLPRVVRYRLHEVVNRLERWPQTSGAKPLRHGLKGHFRIRTGDFRVMFRVSGEEVQIVRIEHRKEPVETDGGAIERAEIELTHDQVLHESDKRLECAVTRHLAGPVAPSGPFIGVRVN